MSHTMAENNYIVTVLAPDADRYNSDPATDIVSLENYDEVTFVISEGAGGTGTAVVTVEKCTDNAGTGATAIAFKYKQNTTLGTISTSWTDATASGFTTTAGANKDVYVRVKSEDVSSGGPWVRVQLTESADDPCDAAVYAILSNPRYGKGDLLSPL